MIHLTLATFVWLLGLCVGSFLNVVVYRLPRGLSVSKPRRSFCPACERPIAAFDNIPVASWLLLRGRCRHCRAAISVQYPLIEALTGLAFVTVYHLLAVTHARAGVVELDDGDWPLVAAWLVLTATMIACSAMDLTAYIIDVRVTDTCMIAGIILSAIWPGASTLEPLARTPLAAAAVAAFVVSGVWLYLTVWRRQRREEHEQRERASDDAGAAAAAGETMDRLHDAAQAAGGPPTAMPAVVAALAVLAGLGVALIVAPAAGWPDAPAVDGPTVLLTPTALLTLFIAIVISGGQRRAADGEIHRAIVEESPHARRVALRELAWLAPPMVAAAAVLAAVSFMPAASGGWAAAVGWRVGGLTPLAGGVAAILGAMVGAAAGWALRIAFTLVFGREAFGTGDIYILAAAGAAAGWDIVLAGLMLSVGLALVGWLLQLLLKSSSMIPFGPWLGLGFVAALWLDRTTQRIAGDYADMLHSAWQQSPQLIYMLTGIMLVGSAAAVAIARLLRVWMEPSEPRP